MAKINPNTVLKTLKGQPFLVQDIDVQKPKVSENEFFVKLEGKTTIQEVYDLVMETLTNEIELTVGTAVFKILNDLPRKEHSTVEEIYNNYMIMKKVTEASEKDEEVILTSEEISVIKRSSIYSQFSNAVIGALIDVLES